ncbi:MAG: hypothetical protein LBT40_16315 [Deltaproteobacteria bacterium]|jgi:hypothetical protein|nr:hypothetical protein [Deltaproteobacteria bacterium]
MDPFIKLLFFSLGIFVVFVAFTAIDRKIVVPRLQKRVDDAREVVVSLLSRQKTGDSGEGGSPGGMWEPGHAASSLSADDAPSSGSPPAAT